MVTTLLLKMLSINRSYKILKNSCNFDLKIDKGYNTHEPNDIKNNKVVRRQLL
jgi:hypothetical protein